MTAVTLQATGGTIRDLVAFRRLERKGSGQVSAVATVSEAGERDGIVWEHVLGDLGLYITQESQDGHAVSLSKVLEIRNYEQGEPSKKASVTPAGRKVASTVNIIDTHGVRDGGDGRHGGDGAGAAAEAEQVCRPPRSFLQVLSSLAGYSGKERLLIQLIAVSAVCVVSSDG
jgi:hypothetical protein